MKCFNLQLLFGIVIVIGIGFWSFSAKNSSFFGNPTIEEINVEPNVDINIEPAIDLDMQPPDVHLHNSSYAHDKDPSVMILIGVTIIWLHFWTAYKYSV